MSAAASLPCHMALMQQQKLNSQSEIKHLFTVDQVSAARLSQKTADCLEEINPSNNIINISTNRAPD